MRILALLFVLVGCVGPGPEPEPWAQVCSPYYLGLCASDAGVDCSFCVPGDAGLEPRR